MSQAVEKVVPLRAALSKKMRFEVFKRDKFTCQYCGGKAPDVVLQCDHIKPVAEGGSSDVMNLVTSCQPCNSGKGARPLADTSVVDKQRRQIEELEERRQQLEMMLEWRDEVQNSKNAVIDAIEERIEGRTSFALSKTGKANLAKLLKKHPADVVLNAIDESFDIYLQYDKDDKPTQESWEKAFKKVGAILFIKSQEATKPHLKQLFYIQGILRRRTQVKWLRCIEALESFLADGLGPDEMEAIAKYSNTWEEFEGHAEKALTEIEGA